MAMRFLEMTILLVFGLFLATGARADIYRWVDQKGVVHFSNYSPADGAQVFLKEKNDTGRQRSSGDGPETIDDVVVAARQEMERVLQEEREREMDRKLDELLRRSQDAEARLAAAEASAAQARGLAQEALAENGNDNGPDLIYVAQPTGYVPDYPLFFSDDCLGYGVTRFPGSFRSSHFFRPFIDHDRLRQFPRHTFGGHPSFNIRFDVLTHHRSYRTIPSRSGFHSTIREASHGFYNGRGRW
jgi:Domain of unknown function (DUF4124)